MLQPASFWPTRAFARGLLVVLAGGFVACAEATTLEEAQQLRLKGDYDECLRLCAQIEPDDVQVEDWRWLEASALLDTGRYPQAENVVSNAIVRSGSVRLRLLGIETANSIGATNLAKSRLLEVNQLAGSRPWAYREPASIVALGRAALLLGVDPKSVLERLFAAAQKSDPDSRDAWLAKGELALDKHDYALAAKTYSEALKKLPNDPEILCGLAQAYQPNARGKMLELLGTALEKNERHVPSLLLLADNLIDAEEYAEADGMLDRALKVNPWGPEAWAYRAVLAHLRNDPADEAQARNKGLNFWPTNPKVDHLIGLKLSQKYRFAEGSAYQQQALAFDPNFDPARIQLAEDLLRLGQESEGWNYAEQVHAHDAYDVTAFNLVMLRGTMRKFQSITNDDFILRMAANEAPLYGDQALALLQRARTRLTEKYGIKLESPTVVEIFPEQKDFGVRTFGMPHNPGFLGVCFGRVVTATSPAAQGGNPANWEAVLWHEFCHVVTLQLTKNKMPRWLSEGISVYEELQANPTWGQKMNPRYREMVLGEDLTPVSELSAAFMTPKSDLHVQFAYYESELAVEYLVGKFGFDRLKAILVDLGSGVNINDAIPKHTAPMPQIEKEFAAFAKAKAEALGPELDWKKPQVGHRATVAGLANAAEHLLSPASRTNSSATSGARNYWSLLEQARKFVTAKQWAEAKAPLKTLIEYYPDQSGPNNAYALLAAAHRGLDETPEERAALEKWAALDDDALEAYMRLMELAEARKDWPAVATNAGRFLAVNPLLPQPYRYLGHAGEELGDNPSATGAYQKLLLLDPADPADVNCRLARLMRMNNGRAAKRHVLQALEEAPRYREAYQLLLQLAAVNTNGISSGATSAHPEVSRP